MAARKLTLAFLAAGLAVATASADERVARGVRAYGEGRYVEAAKLLTPPAELGDPTAETYLGFMSQMGRGAPKNAAEAARWFAAAAKQGEPTAQFFLGALYDRGLGVDHDFVEAYKWFDLAAAHAAPRQRAFWSAMRDAVAGKLSAAELAEGQARARDFAPR